MSPPRRPRKSPSPAPARANGGEWDPLADWYDARVEDPNGYHAAVLAPGLAALIDMVPRGPLLDVGCGQGYFARYLAAAGWQVTGVDLAPQMIARARQRGPASIRYVVDDARTLSKLKNDEFVAAVSVMALLNIDDAAAALAAIARKLRPGGTLAVVILHPAFRFPRQSHWGWDERQKLQYRRVDRYLTPLAVPIRMRPGADPHTATTTYHRPISWYVNAMAAAGLDIDGMEEWTSHRQSTSGPRARAENRARREIPLFLALRARKR